MCGIVPGLGWSQEVVYFVGGPIVLWGIEKQLQKIARNPGPCLENYYVYVFCCLSGVFFVFVSFPILPNFRSFLMEEKTHISEIHPKLPGQSRETCVYVCDLLRLLLARVIRALRTQSRKKVRKGVPCTSRPWGSKKSKKSQKRVQKVEKYQSRKCAINNFWTKNSAGLLG